MALYTIAEAMSSIFGGAAFDVLHLSVHQTTSVLAVIAGMIAVFWGVYAWKQVGVGTHGRSGGDGSGAAVHRKNKNVVHGQQD